MSDGGPLFDAITEFRAAQDAAIGTNSTNITTGYQNLFNNWFGGATATGTPTEVGTTLASIKQAVVGGYTVDTFTSSGTWTKPANLVECWGIVIGGGGRGGVGGNTAPSSGGVGGVGGGYTAQKFDPVTLAATLAITVGAGASTVGANGGVSSVAALLSSSPGTGGIGSPQGYATTSSMPGHGGAGGDITASGVTNGATGESTPLAAGGAGGVSVVTNSNNITGNPGSAGGTASLTGDVKAGGAGGGGGAAVSWTSGFVSNHTGGVGGAGGYPGGGSGGGGAASANSGAVGGQPGSAPNGVVFMLYKTG